MGGSHPPKRGSWEECAGEGCEQTAPCRAKQASPGRRADGCVGPRPKLCAVLSSPLECFPTLPEAQLLFAQPCNGRDAVLRRQASESQVQNRTGRKAVWPVGSTGISKHLQQLLTEGTVRMKCVCRHSGLELSCLLAPHESNQTCSTLQGGAPYSSRLSIFVCLLQDKYFCSLCFILHFL